MSDNTEPCYCVNGLLGGHRRTARCAQPAYPAFASAIANARGGPAPQNMGAGATWAPGSQSDVVISGEGKRCALCDRILPQCYEHATCDACIGAGKLL